MVETLKLANRLFQCKLDCYTKGIQLSNQVAAIIAKHKETRPFHLNVIEAACHGSLKETGHSLILADMLKHSYIQQSFLEVFLHINKPPYLEVTAEKDRVDVALKGDDIFVIVENKVNGAVEQINQVYRYVHEIGMDKYGYTMDKIYVVYLNPTDQQRPSDVSLCDENKQNNVFEAIGADHYVVCSYKYDIMDWLRKITITIANELHVSSALDQYIDFLEQKFHISLLDKKMNDEIKDLLLKELSLEGNSFEEQMNFLENQRAKVEDLLNAIVTVINEMTKQHWHNTLPEWQKQIETSLGIKLSSDNDSFKIKLKLEKDVCLGIWEGGSKGPYWGFKCDGYTTNNMPELDKQIDSILKKANMDPSKIVKESGWVAWNYTENGIEIFSALYKAAKDEGCLDSTNKIM